MPGSGGKSFKISCIIVESIVCISNVHIEKEKKSYQHLQMIWFSDISRLDDKLDVQVLIGADFQLHFLEGEQIRGGVTRTCGCQNDIRMGVIRTLVR